MANNIILEGMFGAGLESNQIGAIKLGIDLGLRIQKILSHVVDEYISGKSLSQLVEENDITELFKVKMKVAQMAVFYALRGYDGHLEFACRDSYTGLMSTDKFEKIANEHHVENARKLGLAYGHISGRLTYKRKIGAHALSSEDKRRFGQQGIIQQGNVPWSDEELKLTFNLSRDICYQRITRINAKKISDYLNTHFHESKKVRKPRSVSKILLRYKNKF